MKIEWARGVSSHASHIASRSKLSCITREIANKAKSVIEDSANSKIVSIASVWEIAIKISLDKFRFPKGFKHFLDMVEDNGFIACKEISFIIRK